MLWAHNVGKSGTGLTCMYSIEKIQRSGGHEYSDQENGLLCPIQLSGKVLRDPETSTSQTPLDMVPVVPWTLCEWIWLGLMDCVANLSDLLVTKNLSDWALKIFLSGLSHL